MLAFFSSKIHTEGHIVLRDLEISMEKSLGDSLRRIPRSRYSPINNKTPLSYDGWSCSHISAYFLQAPSKRRDTYVP
ncbi:unnamed protein product [Brassica oleracea]